MEDFVTLDTLLAESSDNVCAELEYIKSRFPPEVVAAFPALSSITIADIGEWTNPFGFDRRGLRRELLRCIQGKYCELGIPEVCEWFDRFSLLQEVMRRNFGSLLRTLTAVGVSSSEDLLLKYYKWKLEADIPPRTNRWNKMKMFLEERRAMFATE
jgi:hypothetical protein